MIIIDGYTYFWEYGVLSSILLSTNEHDTEPRKESK